MDFQKIISDSTMKNSKEEVLKQIKEQNILVATNLTGKLLKWNSLPLISSEKNTLEISFGVFFLQIIKQSQNQQIRNQLGNNVNQNQQLKDINQQTYIQLCRNVSKESFINLFPPSLDFKTIDNYFQESFIGEIYLLGKQSTCYQSVKFQKQEPVKYKIFLYQSSLDKGMKLNLLFSTNNEPQFPQFQFPQQQVPQQQFPLFKQQSFQQQCTQNIQGNQNFNNIQQPQNQGQNQQQRLLSFPVQQPNNNQFNVRATQFNKNEQQNNNQNQQTALNFNNSQFQNQVQPFQLNIENKNIINKQQNNNIKNNAQDNPQNNNISQNISNCYNPGFQIQKQKNNNGNPFINNNLYTNNPINVGNPSNNNVSSNLFNNYHQFNVQNNIAEPSCQNVQQPINTGGQIQNTNDQITIGNQQQINNNIDIFSTEYIITKQQDQVNVKEVNDYQRILTKCNVIDNFKECEICCESYNLNSDQVLITPCCNKKVHRVCLQNDLNEKAKSFMNFSQIDCFVCQKSLKQYQDYLKNNISIQLFVEIIKSEVLAKISSICCKCSSPIQANLQNKQVQIQCFNCNTKLCSLCYQEYHGENQTNQKCPSLLTEIQKAMVGMPILVCPFCNLMQSKDEKCNHVTCYGCKQDLCSACSVERFPILQHGNHYHRAGCPDYAPLIKNNKVVTEPELLRRNCSRCKETNEPCQYPISLSEYKKLKQF